MTMQQDEKISMAVSPAERADADPTLRDGQESKCREGHGRPGAAPQPAQLTLIPVSTAEAQAVATDTPAAAQSRRLWLCVHLPRLPVHVLKHNAAIPCAAIETVRNRPQVSACNSAAEKRGVQPGMALAAALSLCAELDARERDRRAECARLNDMATAAWQLSASVCLYDAGSVVLEIGGSLKLFNGLGGVLQRAREEFSRLGSDFVFAAAGTPRAACWLARHLPGSYVLFAGELPGLLRGLPVQVLDLAEPQLNALRRSGVRTLGALLRLPRAGVARRFGPEVLQVLDQALGHAPEPLALYAPPQPFRAAEDLYPASDNWTRLQPLAEKLLQRLEHYLLRRQAATQRVRCFLYHEHAPVTVLRLDTSRYERRAAEFLQLLQHQFERTELPVEVVAIGIRCDHLHVIPAANLDLLDGRPEMEQHWRQLLDQLGARLGPGRLSWPQLRDDHRPERAGEGEKIGTEKIGTDLFSRLPAVPASPARIGKIDLSQFFLSRFSPPRPAWLLSQPERLRSMDDHPQWHGALSLSKLPERIEAGWWDGMDVSRDYYLARNPTGSQLWVFRDRREGEWYLQGIFS
jgi:protein ImuB